MGRQHDRRTPSRGSGRLCHSAPLSDGSRLLSHGRQRTHKIGTQRETSTGFDLPHCASPSVADIAWLTSGLRHVGFENHASTNGRIQHKHRQEHFQKNASSFLDWPSCAVLIGAYFSRPVTKRCLRRCTSSGQEKLNFAAAACHENDCLKFTQNQSPYS